MRLTVTRKSDLAIRALRSLAAAPAWVQGDDLAASVGTTRGFLVHVMAPLVRARWVQSTPGPQGGYRLRTPLEAVTVLEVIEAIEGPLVAAACVLEPDRDCATARPGVSRPCALHEPWQAARSALRAELARRPVIAVDPSRAEPRRQR
jgi:Rrf2 family protein